MLSGALVQPVQLPPPHAPALLQMAVVALQPLLSRETDPLQGGVISVTRFNTGGHDLQLPAGACGLLRG